MVATPHAVIGQGVMMVRIRKCRMLHSGFDRTSVDQVNFGMIGMSGSVMMLLRVVGKISRVVVSTVD